MKPRLSWAPVAVLAGLLLVSTCRRSPEVAVALDRAETAEAAARMMRADRDAALGRADSLAMRRVVDSLAYADSLAAWTAERARLASVSRQQSARLSAAADSLRALGDSTVTALVDEMEAAHAEALEAERGQTRAADARADALEVRVGILSAEVTELRSALSSSMASEQVLQAALDYAVGAIKSQSRENRILRLVTLGAVTKVAYDALTGGGL